ncbi:TPA: hypothetical protein ACH3X2_013448 [Trebouxia sp. C0005]
MQACVCSCVRQDRPTRRRLLVLPCLHSLSGDSILPIGSCTEHVVCPLQCLEAEFYSWIANGQGIAGVDSSLVGSNSALTATNSGGQAVATSFATTANGDKDGIAVGLAAEIAANEIAHVKFLRTALTAAGATPVACPAVSISPATFLAAATAAATAAGVTLDSTSTFDPYSTAAAFFLAAFIFEDVGVTAYHGAIANLENPTYASAAAGIMAIEAGHAAVIREQLFLLASADTTAR